MKAADKQAITEAFEDALKNRESTQTQKDIFKKLEEFLVLINNNKTAIGIIDTKMKIYTCLAGGMGMIVGGVIGSLIKLYIAKGI